MKRFFVVLFFFGYSFALVVGSESSGSVQLTSVTFPQVDTDNELLGFVSIRDGFNLENAMTTCTFNAQFPVSGNVCLNRGTLFLEQDLILTDTGKFISGGRIEGGDRSIIFPSSVGNTFVPSDPVRSFSLIDRFTDIAAVESLDWSFNSSYIVTGLSTNASDEVVLLYFDGNTLTETNQVAGTTDVDSVAWHPSDHFFVVTRDVGADNELSFHFLDVNSGSIVNGSVLNVAIGLPAIAWGPTGEFLALAVEAAAVELLPLTFDSGTAGGGFTIGTLLNIAPDRNVQQDSLSWGPLGNNYLAAGMTFLSVTDPELLVCSFDQASVAFTITASANVGASITAVDWSPTGSFIAVGIGSSGSERLRIYEHSVQNGSLLEIQAARIGESASVLALDWGSDGRTLAVGLETNSGTELRLYDFNQTSGELTLKTEFENTVTVSTLKFSPNGNYIAIGDESFNTSVYDFSTENIFNNVELVFNSDVTFKGPIVIEGDCSINGNGFIMGLESGGSFSLSAGSTLSISNVTVTGLMDSNIVCGDDDASLILTNIKLELSSDYTFSRGTIFFKEDNRITGSNVFAYTSPFGSTIDSLSTLLVDLGATLSVYPTSANNELFIMTDTSSKLHFKGSTLSVSSTGLKLTDGTLILEGAPIFISDATSLPEAIIFGDSGSELSIEVLPGTPLTINSGFLNCNNA